MQPHSLHSVDSTAQMGSDSIGRLVWRFSMPAIIGMVVNALYNIVDRMFIGYGVGTLGIAAITVSFPLMLVMTAFSVLVGIGANTLFSLRMGEGRKDEAELILGNAFILLVAGPLLASLAALVWLEPLLRLLGASDLLMPYAKPYAAIVICGSAMSTTGHGLSHFLRSDGHPRKSMMAMLIGGILNTLLDPLFIFVFHWGIAGAAWATVISQGCAFLWCFLHFLSPSAGTRLRRACLRLEWRRVVWPFLALGFTPFAMHLANSLLNAVLNRSLHLYGGEDSVAIMGILAAYMSIIFMPAMGITSGVQPLMGYNYGAQKFLRVRRFFWLSMWICTAVMTLGGLASQLFPVPILRLFVPADSTLIPNGIRAMRIFTAAFPLIAFPVMVGTLFQAIGKPIQAGFLALSRQLILFVPFLLLLPRLLPRLFPSLAPIHAVYMAAPASDLLTFSLALLMGGLELRRLRALERREIEEPAP